MTTQDAIRSVAGLELTLGTANTMKEPLKLLLAHVRKLEAENDSLRDVLNNCLTVLDKNAPVSRAERVGATGTVYTLLKSWRGK